MIKSPPSPSDYADERARPEEYLLRLQDQRRRAYIQDPFGSTFDRSGSLPQEGLIQQRGRSTLVSHVIRSIISNRLTILPPKYQNDLTYPSKFLRPGTQYLASPNDLYFKVSGFIFFPIFRNGPTTADSHHGRVHRMTRQAILGH